MGRHALIMVLFSTLYQWIYHLPIVINIIGFLLPKIYEQKPEVMDRMLSMWIIEKKHKEAWRKCSPLGWTTNSNRLGSPTGWLIMVYPIWLETQFATNFGRHYMHFIRGHIYSLMNMRLCTLECLSLLIANTILWRAICVQGLHFEISSTMILQAVNQK